jgi:hypothetical protein
MNKTTFLRKETREKLNFVAEAVYAKHTSESANLSNIKSIIRATAEELAKNKKMQGISHQTLATHQDYIIKRLKQIHLTQNIIIEQEEQSKTILDKIKSITIKYESGAESIFIEKVEIKEEKQKEFAGLFNYIDDNNVIIRRDKRFIGCNVKNLDSIIEYFKSLAKFKDWCFWAIQLAESKDFKKNADTDRDVEFLKKIIVAINKRQQKNWL